MHPQKGVRSFGCRTFSELTRPSFAGFGRSANDGIAMLDEDCQKKAADLGFDLTKQFLTLAFAGIAFVVGLSFSTPGAVSSVLLWLVIAVFHP